MENTIGKYKILREIGKGGMAVVYKAVDPESKRVVALKVLLPTMVNRATAERFNREAQAMARLKHPNIVGVYDFGATKGEHYFAMELVEGESLKSMVKYTGSLSIEKGLDIVTQVCQALAYAHNEGMIHRDIKSGNIVVDREGKVKVMDFGLVQIPGVTRVTSEGSAVGTAEYMSPEQISGAEVDLRTDIYSLGVTMYEILTGRSPFEADTFHAVLMKHKYETPPHIKQLRPDIPAELERIVMKAMAKDVGQRYQRIEELLEDINRFRGIRQPSGEIKVQPASLSTPTQKIQEEAIAKGRVSEKEETPPLRPAISGETLHAKEEIEIKQPQKKILLLAFIGIIVLGTLGYVGYLYRDLIFPKRELDVKEEIKEAPEKETGLLGETELLLKRLETAEEHYKLGLKFYKDGIFNSAIAEYQNAIKLRPDYPLYYKDLATACEQKGDYEMAIKAWQDLLKYDQSGTYTEIARQHIERLETQQ